MTFAHNNGDFVLPLYCFDPRHFKGTHHYNFPKTGNFRVQFLLESVLDLRNQLVKRGSNLMIVCEKPEEAISRIYSNLHEYNLTLVCQSEVTKEETDVEQNLKRISEKNKANFITIWGSTLYHKSDMPFSIASVPDSYTAFRKDVEHRLKIRPEVSMPEKLKPLPTFGSMIPWGDLPSYEVLNSSKPLDTSKTKHPKP